MLELHTAATANGLRPRIMLEECGLDHELHVVDLEAGDHLKPDYLALNPMGLVPALVVRDDGDAPAVITQSMNILVALARRTGRFLPERLDRDPEFWSDCWGIATDLTGTLMSVLVIGRGKEPHAPTMEMFGKRLNRYLRTWNGRFAERRYCAGDEVTIADFALYPVILRCRAVVPAYAEGCPDIDRWHDEMSARPALARALDLGAARTAARP